MNCEQVRSNLLAYLDGEVADAERARVEAHLASCPDCADELARLRALRADLRDVVPTALAHLSLPRQAEDRIRAQLRRVQKQRGFRETLADTLSGLWRPRPGLLKAAIGLVVALFLTFTGLFGTLPAPVSAQETIVIGPGTLAPGTDAALRVIVRDLESARPVAGAEVAVSLRPQGEYEVVLYTGHTGDQGSADIRFRVPSYEQDDLSADLIVTSISPRGRDQVTQRVTVRRSFRILLTSDKPLYQPGQTIHLRVLALEEARGLPAAERPVVLQVQGTNGERVFERTVRTSSYGIAATDYQLPADASHGIYRLIAAFGDTVSTRTVTVGHYERPRFKVDLSLERPYYLRGQVVQGRVAARSLAGDDLPGMAVVLRAYLHDPGRRLVATAQGRTDETGAFVYRFGLPSDLLTEHANLALEAAVTDETGRVEWAGSTAPVAAEPMAIDVVAEGGRLRPGVANTIYLLVTAPDGTPVHAQLDVGGTGKPYKLTTNEYGLAQFRFTPAPGTREVQIQVSASDAEGQVATRTVSLSADSGPAQVLLRPDRAAYKVGETVRLEILSGQGEVVYVDVARRQGGQVLSTHVAKLRDGRANLAIDVSPLMAGTLELHAYQVLPDGTLTRDARLVVVDAPNQVAVDIHADKPTYSPGDVARVTVDTRLDGRPVQSAVGIAVVDESVFALEERAPGFAKLFFLLEADLLGLRARPLGVGLPELLDPPDATRARAAQDAAARAAWAKLPAGDLNVQRSTVSKEARVPGRLRGLGLGLAGALLVIPLASWAAILRRLAQSGSWRPALWRTALVLGGLTLACIVPTMSAGLIGLVFWMGRTPGRILLAASLSAWLMALAVLGIQAWRRRDDGVQIATLLVGAYGVLAALLGYVAEQGGDPGLGIALAVAAASIAMPVALLVLASGLWVEKKRAAASLTYVLALLSIALAVLAGATLAPSSLFARTVTDPRVYTGPLGWLTGCAAAPKTVPDEKAIRETARVEKEVTSGFADVGKEASEATGEGVATPTPQPTMAPTASPVLQPTATPLPVSDLPPPLIGQFVPETIYWAPEVLTDDQGHMAVDIPLPDAPATWRLTAIASTRQGELGGATATLRVSP